MSTFDVFAPEKKAVAKKAAAPAPAPAEEPKPVVPDAYMLPLPVATRSYAGDQWDEWVPGQVPTGKRGVMAIKFADGSVFDLGKGWQK